MKRSNIYIPQSRIFHNNELTRSHNLLMNSGMIRQIASGMFAWMPFGKIALNNVIGIVKKHMDNISNEFLAPCVQPLSLWDSTKRADLYGKEMLIFKDRNDNELTYAPTHEEAVAFIMQMDVSSYRDLPISLYQINNKFRDEIRPRSGVIRSKEFIMKDAYSIHASEESARDYYIKYFNAYCDIFNEIGFKYIITPVDSCEMGGDLSHEFIMINNKYDIHQINSYDEYVEFDNKHVFKQNKDNSQYNVYIKQECVFEGDIIDTGIEIGHIFNLGDKYTVAMKVECRDANNEIFNPLMCSYGIGISRILGALCDLYDVDSENISLPKSIMPFNLGLITFDCDENTIKYANKIYNDLLNMKGSGINPIYDDRNLKHGKKFQDMESMGVDYNIIVSKNNLHDIENGLLEVRHNRHTIKVLINELCALDL